MNLTVKQVAERLGVSPSLIYVLVSKKQLGHVRIGNGRGILRIPEEALTAYLERQTVAPAALAPAATPAKILKHLEL